MNAKLFTRGALAALAAVALIGATVGATEAREIGRPRVARLVRQELAVAGTAMGITDPKQLRQELKGSTLTAVAEAHHVQPATVASAMKTDLNSKIDALVASGKLKVDRATALKQRAAQRVDTFMTHQFKAARG